MSPPEPRAVRVRSRAMPREALIADFALRYHDLLFRVSPKKPSLGARLLLEKAHRIEASEGTDLAEALELVFREAERRVERMLELATRHGYSLGQGP